MVIADNSADDCNILKGSAAAADKTDMVDSLTGVDHEVVECYVLECSAGSLAEESVVGVRFAREVDIEAMHCMTFAVDAAGEGHTVVAEACEVGHTRKIDICCEDIVETGIFTDFEEILYCADFNSDTGLGDMHVEFVASGNSEVGNNRRIHSHLEGSSTGAGIHTVHIACIYGVFAGFDICVIVT